MLISPGVSLAMFVSQHILHYLKHLFLLTLQRLSKDGDGPVTGNLPDLHPCTLKDESFMLAILRSLNGSAGRKRARATFNCSTARSKRNVSAPKDYRPIRQIKKSTGYNINTLTIYLLKESQGKRNTRKNAPRNSVRLVHMQESSGKSQQTQGHPYDCINYFFFINHHKTQHQNVLLHF